MRTGLLQKEQEAVKFIRKAYQLALSMSDEGFHVAFSGGKDSQVLLALMELSGCKYKAHMQVTSVDPPQLMKFIRSNYSQVELHLPEKNMKRLIIEKGMLPIRNGRYCCEKLKEIGGGGTCVCTGIRAAESIKRAKRTDIEITAHKRQFTDIEGCELHKCVQSDLFEVKSDTVISCVTGKDKVLISPIFNWSNADVWNFIRGNRMEYCELYNMGWHRIGCLFCPMASKREKAKEYRMFPRFAEKVYIPAIRELREKGKYLEFASAEDVFFWWISNKNRKEFLSNKRMNKLF
ncbi:Phosphoadenosine phosphosulfate reductase [termite gut metagenome]|uniref:Phosphoadenosine phosphosulfate reductase n=1 Tax=termite gut metagenome TaxID=433724 RepID=A0A5J4RU18_9ZZZZ